MELVEQIYSTGSYPIIISGSFSQQGTYGSGVSYLRIHEEESNKENILRFRLSWCKWIKIPKIRLGRLLQGSIPNNIPEARVSGIRLHCFVDTDHASDKVTRRWQTVIFIIGNRASFVMFSKRQNSAQTSTFGSEFWTLRQAVELVQTSWFKIRQFGIPLEEGGANLYCDNKAVY